MTSEYNDSYVNELEAYFIGRNDIINRYGNMISHFQALPGLVGLWYPGNVQRSTGNIYDSSGQNRTLTYNGNPTINYLPNGVAYADLDGVGDYYSRADETDLDILGTETWAANKGLTFFIWVRFSAPLVATEYIASKFTTTGNQRSWWLRKTNTGLIQGLADQNGDSLTESFVQSSVSITDTNWHSIALRFVPSTSLDIYVDGTKTTNAIAIVASLFNSNAALLISGINASVALMTADWSIAALCANALNDATINGLSQQTRSLYGV